MIKTKKIAVLVVAFIGVPETVESKLKDSYARYIYTKRAFLSLQKKINNKNLFLGLVGDKDECNRFILEVGLSDENAKWFEQDKSLISSGAGALENQLILNCIKFWFFEEKFDIIIKVTGKYNILNIEDILLFAQKINQSFYAWKFLFRKMVDTRVLIFKPNFYILNQSELNKINVKPGFWVENITYQIIKKNFYKYGLILYRPILQGWAGTTNEFSFTPYYKSIFINIVTKIDINFKNICQKFEALLKLLSK